MKNLIVCSFFGTALLFMLNEFNKDRLSVVDAFPKGKCIVLNPLDAVFGEKLLDDGSLRKDNFDVIRSISAKFLTDSSAVYRIQKLNRSTFLLNQRVAFRQASTYSLLVKIETDRIVSYHAITNFYVKSVVQKEEKFYLLCDDYREGRYQLKLICLDDSLNEKWEYSPKSREFPFEANSLVSNADLLIASVSVIGSCSICLTHVSLVFNEDGKLIDAKQNGVVNSGPLLDESHLKRLFGNF